MSLALDFCLEARDAGLPPFECRYSDGTRLVTGPPPGDCPASDPRNPFCGGACGTDVICPQRSAAGRPGSCVGLSDTRSHGICAVGFYFGSFLIDDAWRGQVLEICADRVGDPCAYLVLRPQDFSVDTEMGYPVMRSACLAYRARFPDGVDCVDADWSSLP